ncbi:hypothetical protein QEJ31_07825 [Pigmentibacter sp. JX0631]|uniref:hypothetical protein n=1 Tax=Pigmentibacter sp. JX0631 TaxID=2976982 RepID=UPI0024699FA5|nr:hypothetical protein [Pigmentibacter sp. JX0631]WGL61497.1 hypothetical protein QEJ31_07825 [Pigmentibacter sp. JX0631]
MSLNKLNFKLNVLKSTTIGIIAVVSVSCSTVAINNPSKILKNKLEKILESNLSEEDIEFLQDFDSVNLAFAKISESKFDSANEIAQKILYKPNLSISLYKYAFKAYTISSLLNESKYPKKDNIIKNFDFNSFQDKQCSQLCDSPGWKVLVKNEVIIFSLNGYNDIVLSDDIFALIKQEKPILSIDPIFLGFKQINFQNVSFQTSPNLILGNELQIDLDEKIALSYFLHGEFTKSIELFTKLLAKTSDISFRSFCYYWIGRSYSALSNFAEAKKYYYLSGNENPLGLYDALSGQMLNNISGRASTIESSPFLHNWEFEKNKWIKYQFNEKDNSEIIIGLKYAILSLTKLKLDYNVNDIETMQKVFKNEKSLEKLILNDEISWLTKTWENKFSLNSSNENKKIISNNITWLNYVVGNYLQAILLISKIKDTLDPLSEQNNFLYFLFYPQFYKEQMLKANNSCHVDPDLMYAIFRQEGFFQSEVISDDVAIQKVCNLKYIMDRYKNNIVNTLSAYRAGTELTDIWLNENVKINDDPIFMEYIPDSKIKEFVQGVMKNYYNFKWIYYNRN